MITYAEALNCIAAALGPVPAKDCAPRDALGAGIGSPVASRLDVPDFDNAAVDGIAVRAADLTDAGPERPAELPVVGIVPAGRLPDHRIGPGEATEIMTGAPLPGGADAVLPVESIQWREGPRGMRIARVTTPVEPGRNVRRAGADFQRGDVLLDTGDQLTPAAVMALAAAGVDHLPALPPPAVAVITTGSELASSGAPAGSGRIRDANGPYLAAAIGPMGGLLTSVDAAADTPEAVVAALGRVAPEVPLIVTTGGVSAGRFDCVPDGIQGAGGRILFHRVAIRPGKPLLFASLPGGRWLLGLPGNPVAVAVGLRFFVAAALRALRGLAPEQLLPAISTGAIRKRPGLRFFGKAVATVSSTGRLEVALLRGQESFRVRPLLAANCWAVVGEDREAAAPGELIQVAPLFPTAFPAAAVTAAGKP